MSANLSEPPADDRRSGLQPPRFGLGTLLLAVGLLGLMFAFIHYVGMYGSLIVVFFLLCVLAHVAGNAIGTRLRDIGSQPDTDSQTDPQRSSRGVAPQDFAPATNLREKSSLGKPIVAVTACGAVLGGTVGGIGLLWLTAQHPSAMVMALGIGASAVLGGIWTFAAGSFIQVLLGA